MWKFRILRHSFPILLTIFVATILLVVALVLLCQNPGAGAWKFFAIVIAALLSGGFFLVKQKESESRLLLDLMKYFNEQYEKLREKIDDKFFHETENLVGYLNLCSEEYFYYRQGHIPPDVWEVWRRGMFEKLKYHEDATRKELCCGKDYYGLTWEKIKGGDNCENRKCCRKKNPDDGKK